MTPMERAFFEAVANGKADVVAQMLRTNRELLSSVDDESNPPRKSDNPVHLAARLNQIAVLNVILEVSSDEKNRKRSDNGVTPILLASAKQHEKVVERLLKERVDLTAVNRNDKQFSSIFYAVNSGNAQIVQALVDAGADLNYRADNGQNALDLADNLDNKQIINILIKSKEAKLKKLERQKAELKKQEAELAANAGKIQSDLGEMREKHKQEEIKYLSKVTDFVLDQYKSAAVDGVDRSHQFEEMQRYNREVLAKLSPNAQQAYAEAQRRQAQAASKAPSSSGQTAESKLKP